MGENMRQISWPYYNIWLTGCKVLFEKPVCCIYFIPHGGLCHRPARAILSPLNRPEDGENGSRADREERYEKNGQVVRRAVRGSDSGRCFRRLQNGGRERYGAQNRICGERDRAVRESVAGDYRDGHGLGTGGRF